MNILVLDTETTGLPEDPNARVIEVAAAVYSTKYRTPVWSLGAITPWACDVPEETTAIHGISTEMLLELDGNFKGYHAKTFADLRVAYHDYCCSALVAHRADFDREMMSRKSADWAEDMPWVCSREDIQYPHSSTSRRLIHLAVDHGIIRTQTHRALDDVLLLCELLGKVENLEEQVLFALEPKGIFRALVSFYDKDLAKERGFVWEREGCPAKTWTKKMPVDEPLEPTEDRPFALRRLS